MAEVMTIMAKTLTNLNKPFTGVGGEILIDEKSLPIVPNKFLANLISFARSSDSVRAIIIAQQIYKAKDTLTLEDADYTFARDIVMDAQIANILKNNLLEIFDGTKKTEKNN